MLLGQTTDDVFGQKIELSEQIEIFSIVGSEDTPFRWNAKRLLVYTGRNISTLSWLRLSLTKQLLLSSERGNTVCRFLGFDCPRL